MKNKQKAFTIVETLVAIMVLMIAIAGPLTISSKAYTASLDAQNQIEATFLAQGVIEYFNHLKDNNDVVIGDWDPAWDNDSNTKPSVITDCNSDSICHTLNTLPFSIPSKFILSYYFEDYGQPDQVTLIVTVSWTTVLNNSVTMQQVLTNYDR